MWWLLFLTAIASACTMDFQCPNALCWRGACVDPMVRSGFLNWTMGRNCVREVEIYLNLFYDETCEVQDVIPTEYGVECRCRCVSIQHNTTLQKYRYGPHNARLRLNDTFICVYSD